VCPVCSSCAAPHSHAVAALVTTPTTQVGPEGHVIGAVSGGVDSSVAAVLLHRAIGARFHAIMVDNGCLRKVGDPSSPPPASCNAV
jgi:GMP synthase PP-ATPase subunit